MCFSGLATGCDMEKVLKEVKGIVQEGLEQNEREANELARIHDEHDIDGHDIFVEGWSLSSSDPSTCFEVSELSADESHSGAIATLSNCDTNTPHKMSRSCDASLLLPSLLENSVESEGLCEAMTTLP
jgi:hypothetical protein